MAYGTSRRSRSYDPDPRDVVEEAAHAAGMSVDEWLNAATPSRRRYDRAPDSRASESWISPEDDNDSPLKAITRRLERRGIRGPAAAPLPEDRVTRILNDAMEGVHESLRANEERTASALDALSRQLSPERQGIEKNRVRSLIGDLERGLNTPAVTSPHPDSQNSDLVSQLEHKIANVVSMIEAKSKNIAEPPAVAAAPVNAGRPNVPMRDTGGRDLRPLAHIGTALQKVTEALRGLEQSPRQTEILHTLRSLDQRLSGLEQGPPRSPEAINSLVGEMTALRQAVAQQRNGLDVSDVNHQIASIGSRIDSLSQSLARQTAPTNHFDKLFNEISDLRGQLKASVSTPDPGIAALQQQMSSMGNRLDALTDKLAALRMNAPRDLRPVKAIDGDLDELKRLIMASQVPSHDGRVLDALQTLERKVAAMERTPTELSARLDRIQSMMGERPPAQLPVHIEALLQGLADKLKDIASGPDDDLAFAKLHQEIQLISRKLEQTPGAMQHPAIADMSGLERSVSAILNQMDSLKADMGNVAETAARKATQEAISRIPAPAAVAHTDVSGIERSIAGLFSQIDGWKADMGLAAAEAARQAAQEALSRMPIASSTPVTDLSGVEHSIQGLFQQMDSWKADMGAAAAEAARKAAQDAVSRMPAAPSAPVPDLSGVEHSIQGLFQQMDSWKADMGAVAENAARKAAAEAMMTSTAMQLPATQTDTVELQRALSDMQMSQKDAEQKTAQTLEAVHNTLKRVVDRLVDMEKDMDQRALAPIPAAPVHASAPLPTDDGARKPLAAQTDVLQARPLQPLTLTAQPDSAPVIAQGSVGKQGVAETVASLRAQRLGVSSPTVTTTTPPTKGGIGGMLAAARGVVSNIKLPKGKARVEPSLPLAASVGLPAQPVSAPTANTQPVPKSVAASSADVPLEPGSGRPTQKQPGTMPEGDDASDPKAQFLAAARRAAQSAAAQTGEALTAEKSLPAKTMAKAGSTKTSRLKPKHALLLGLAALVVAAGATLQFVGTPRLLGGKEPSKDITGSIGTLDHIRKQVQLSHQQRKNSVEYSAEAAKAPPRQILPPSQNLAAPQNLAPAIEAPLPPPISRDVKASETTAAPAAMMEAAKAQLSAGPNTVGAIGPTIQSNIRPQVSPPQISPAKQAPGSSEDPLFRFEGLRDAQRLKDAARSGDLAAYMEIGIRYAEGRGAARDPKTAALWFERAGELGSAPAKYRLGAMYREGRGVDRNPKVALLHFQNAAEAGNARAMHNTAVLLAEGVNGAPDYAAAADWFKKAAELGVKDSQFNLAILYARGLGIGQDLAASYSWFSAAAATGDDDAAKKRDEVGARMSPEVLSQAKTAAGAWKPKTPDPAANEINTPPGGWDAPAKTSEPVAKPKRSRT